jgi:predicted ATPase
MFSSIRLRNVRSFKDSGTVPLRPLTLLVGPNNAGKSTLLNTILLLAQSIQGNPDGGQLATSGPLIDLGSFDDIVRGGIKAKDRSFSIDLRLPDAQIERELNEYRHGTSRRNSIGDHLSVRFSFNRAEDRIEVDHSAYYNGKKLLVALDRRQNSKADEPSYSLRGNLQVPSETLSPSLRNFLPQVERSELPDRQDPLFSDILDAQLNSMIRNQIWADALQRVELIAPLREPIPRYTFLGRTAPTPAGVASGGEAVLQLLRSADRLRRSNQDRLVDLVDYWLSRRFQLTKDLRVVDVDRAARVLSLVANQKGGFAGINIANMGEGVSQLLPIIASIVMLDEWHAVLVEQPEIHLHPAAQADLGDLMIAGIGKSKKRQVIVETHSEHLLLRVRRRIAEGKLNPGDVAVLYVEKPGGASRIRHLTLDESGNFDDWPAGFFDEAYQEALQLSLAGSSS